MNVKALIYICAVAVSILFPVPSIAQTSQILSVTPPLFQLSAEPGDVWQSSVKVVNGNAYPITVYAEVANFEPVGEVGQGKFVPIVQGVDEVDTGLRLAEWITITAGPHVIPPEQTMDIPFFVDVPETAPPGGHYSAILITTKPPLNTNEPVLVKTSQTVTSLFFVRIEGDVVEEGSIREFRALDRILEKPDVEFSLRFENKGNVHLQPRGSIVITNMWGTERGIIPVNYQTHFGNVLPNSIRDFRFSWAGEFSVTDIGRYTAEATLVYGEDGIQNTHAKIHFWIIPVKATLITLAIVALCIWLIVWMVKAYIRRMLALAGVHVDDDTETVVDRARPVQKPRIQYRDVSAPLKDGVLDLRSRLSTVDETQNIFDAVLAFIRAYKKFFLSLALLIGIVVLAVMYLDRATEEHDRYRVIIEEGGVETVIDGSEITDTE